MTTTTKKKLAIEARRKKVAANLLAGLNYRDLAEVLGVSTGTICSDVKAILKDLRRQQIDEMAGVVEVEVRRLDRALNAIWPKVQAGDLRAIDTLISLQNQRARYQGLYADTRLEIDSKQELNITLNSLEQLRKKRWEEVAGQIGEFLTGEKTDEA